MPQPSSLNHIRIPGGTPEYSGGWHMDASPKNSPDPTPPYPGRLVPARQVTSLQDGALRILERATGHTGEPGCGRTPSVPAHPGGVLPRSVCCCHPLATCTAPSVPHSPSRRGVQVLNSPVLHPKQAGSGTRRAGCQEGTRTLRRGPHPAPCASTVPVYGHILAGRRFLPLPEPGWTEWGGGCGAWGSHPPRR